MPGKLTPAVHKAIVDRVRAGNHPSVAAGSVGVAERTIYDWLKGGSLAKSGIYYQLYHDVKKAETEAEVRNVAIIEKAATEQWTAAAWWLERKHNDRWGRRERREITGKDGGPVEVADARQDLARRIDELAERRRSQIHLVEPQRETG